MAEHPVGGVCLFARNIEDRFQVAELTSELRTLCGDALLIATDQEGGGVVRSLDVPYPPSAMALGAADDSALTEKVGAATAHGLRAQGINLNFAPVADVNSNPRNPVIADRSFGEDPERVARHVAAFIRGTQGAGVAACVKHFPGHGDTETDSHLGLPVLEADLARLEGLEFVPFCAALAADVAAVMSAHIVLLEFDAAQPATLSHKVLTGLLRHHLGFDGVVFTDALNMRAIADRCTPTEAVLGALAAGADMPVHVGPLSEHREIVRGLGRALDEGRLEPASVKASLERVSKLARRYPAQPDPDAAWAEGDAVLLQLAAGRALVRFGELNPKLPLTLVAATQVRASAASQITVSPVEKLKDVLEDAGFSVQLLLYTRETLTEARALLPRVAQAPGRTVRVYGPYPNGRRGAGLRPSCGPRRPVVRPSRTLESVSRERPTRACAGDVRLSGDVFAGSGCGAGWGCGHGYPAGNARAPLRTVSPRVRCKLYFDKAASRASSAINRHA